MSEGDTSKNTVKVSTMYGDFICWDDDLITNQLRQFSAHTRNELAMLNSFINEGDTIIDIGAHIGTYSIPFSKKVGRKGKIFTFEANPHNFALLEKNIKLNGLQATIFPNKAIVTSDNTINYKMSLPSGGNSGMYYFSEDGGQSGGEVCSICIDQWFFNLSQQAKVNLIKIDVEGAEVSILKSCEAIIKKFKPILYIEVSKEALKRFGNTTNDLHEILSQEGYQYYKNVGERNSTNDRYEVRKLNRIDEGGEFFDLLAFYKNDSRRPSILSLNALRLGKWGRNILRRIKRKIV